MQEHRSRYICKCKNLPLTLHIARNVGIEVLHSLVAWGKLAKNGSLQQLKFEKRKYFCRCAAYIRKLTSDLTPGSKSDLRSSCIQAILVTVPVVICILGSNGSFFGTAWNWKILDSIFPKHKLSFISVAVLEIPQCLKHLAWWLHRQTVGVEQCSTMVGETLVWQLQVRLTLDAWSASKIKFVTASLLNRVSPNCCFSWK